MHFAYDLDISSRKFDLFVKDVLEVFLSAFTFEGLWLDSIERYVYMLFVEVMVLVTHVKKNLSQIILQLRMLIVFELLQVLSWQGHVK